ncbi:MAG: hypothetical protein JXR72_03550 [Proteobacteria bacterium]|nr:hypothetical protein [Pseudomonadota bacterium]
MKKHKVAITEVKEVTGEIDHDLESLPADGLLERGNFFQENGMIDKALAYLKMAFERSPETTTGKIAIIKFASLKMRCQKMG